MAIGGADVTLSTAAILEILRMRGHEPALVRGMLHLSEGWELGAPEWLRVAVLCGAMNAAELHRYCRKLAYPLDGSVQVGTYVQAGNGENA